MTQSFLMYQKTFSVEIGGTDVDLPFNFAQITGVVSMPNGLIVVSE